MAGEYTGDFAIVGEGHTDQLVLDAALNGFFEVADDLRVNYEQPSPDQTGGKQFPPGGWDQVRKYLKGDKFLGALQTNRYLVVHIDTDVSDVFVPRAGLTPAEHVIAIVAYLQGLIAGRAPLDRFIFAIAIDSIECWLLPLVFDRSEKANLTKVAGCLKAVNDKLRMTNGTLLSKGDGSEKAPEAYRRLSKGLEKRKGLDVAAVHNLGFTFFVTQLAQLEWKPVAGAS